MEMMHANESLLLADGRAGSLSRATASGPLEWPVALAPGIDDFDCWAIVTLVDHDSTIGSVLDYNCGNRTYDLPTGYNHAGVDFLAWPFPWIKTENDEMYAVAAQAGIVIGKIDGNPDHNCSMTQGIIANTVIVRHDDGSRALYAHLKSGSLTTKQIGDFVDTGEYLGVVGSSGRSPVPHMHFEMLDADGRLIDPFMGSCNDLNESSWWSEQTPYRTPGINKVSTHSQQVEFPPCPNQEVPHYQDAFQPGQEVYSYAFGHDMVNGMSLTFRLIRPDGVPHKVRTYTASTGDYNSFYYWFSETMPSGHDGTWTVEVDFDGDTYSHQFGVGVVTVVAFTSIDAYAVDGGVAVEWEVYADEEISGYVVRRDSRPIGNVASGVHTLLDTAVRPGQTYTYDVLAELPDGREIVSIEVRVHIPDVLTSLSQNYPNPFNPTTTIEYFLAVEGNVVLSVHDVSGRRLVELGNGREDAGNHSVAWDGRGPAGNPVASGTYFYRLTVDGVIHSRKMIFLK
jgi:murein DD-endopeptidase MepM/ murein hydrolase activator NlpD